MATFIPVKKEEIHKRIRKRKGGHKDLQGMLREFMDSNIAYARYVVAVSEYANTRSAYKSTWSAIRLSGYPIQIHMDSATDTLYLERTDL